MSNQDVTKEWREYENGKDYNRKINLYVTVDKNERFYAGDQWRGVQANGLPTPVFNLFKRVINYFIAAILSQKVKMQFVPENIGDEPQNEQELDIKQKAEIISSYSETLWEKLKMDTILRQALLDAALSGDAGAYNWLDMSKDTGQEAEGEIDLELVDNVNVFFGNPTDKRVEKQPYIIIAFREQVSNLRTEAKNYGVRDEDIKRIVADNDTQDQSGDMAKVELDRAGEENGKTTTIIKFWRDKDGTISWTKATKAVVIRKDVKTKRKRYPISWKNWDSRKNSYHGQAVGTGLVPNQVFINKMFAMVMLNLMYTAFPKAVYNKKLIPNWTNVIGEAIAVEKGDMVNVRDAATYLEPGNMSAQVMQVIDAAINYTKDLVGASDAALGDIRPENHSAIIAVQQAAAVPLENIKANLYQFVEDIGYIWLDLMASSYGKRDITVTMNGKRQVIPFDFDQLQNMRLQLKIDVGPSSYWSEITSMQTLDNLLQQEKITFVQYLERVSNGYIPDKESLIEELKAKDMDQQFIGQVTSQFARQLPPEIQQQLAQMPPDQQMMQIKQMMMGMGGGQPQMMGGQLPPGSQEQPPMMGGDL